MINSKTWSAVFTKRGIKIRLISVRRSRDNRNSLKKSFLNLSFIIEDKAFDNIFFQSLGGPNPKLSGLLCIDSIPNSDSHIEVIKIDVTIYLAISITLNYPEFPDSSIFM